MRTVLAASAALGLTLGLMGGAQAQTVSGFGPAGSFVVDLLQSYVAAPDYTYDYVATLDRVTPGASVNDFQYQFQEPVYFESATGGFVSTDPTYGSTFSFTSPSGLSAKGDQVLFQFYSPDSSDGIVSVTAAIPGVIGSGSAFGPLPSAVPESASLTLFSLGALPVGLLARRRSLGL